MKSISRNQEKTNVSVRLKPCSETLNGIAHISHQLHSIFFISIILLVCLHGVEKTIHFNKRLEHSFPKFSAFTCSHFLWWIFHYFLQKLNMLISNVTAIDIEKWNFEIPKNDLVGAGENINLMGFIEYIREQDIQTWQHIRVNPSKMHGCKTLWIENEKSTNVKLTG